MTRHETTTARVGPDADMFAKQQQEAQELFAELQHQIGDDVVLLRVILDKMEELRWDAELVPYLPRLRELRTLVLSSHGKEGLAEWEALCAEIDGVNAFGRGIAAMEDRQLRRLLSTAGG